MKKQIVIIMNGKGGVGKSFFTNNFIDYLKIHTVEHRAIDTDNENSTLKRFHPEAQFVNLSNTQEMDAVFAALQEVALVVVDCRAASTDILLDYFTEISVFEILETLGAALTIVSLVNHEADSVEQVKIIADNLGGRCHYVIVRNEVHSELFGIYERSHVRNRIMNDFAGYEIVMSRLYDWLVATLNDTNLPISKAIQHPDISLIDRQRLKNWQREFNQQIEAAKAVLLPPEETAQPELTQESKTRQKAS